MHFVISCLQLVRFMRLKIDDDGHRWHIAYLHCREEKEGRLIFRDYVLWETFMSHALDESTGAQRKSCKDVGPVL